jgi:hypothetical protein
MGTVWLGVRIGIGIILAFAAFRVSMRWFGKFASRSNAKKFTKAGFQWEENQNVQGWLTRDPDNDDWILWDCPSQRMLRSSDNDSTCKVSTETRDECLSLGRRYWKRTIG